MRRAGANVDATLCTSTSAARAPDSNHNVLEGLMWRKSRVLAALNNKAPVLARWQMKVA